MMNLIPKIEQLRTNLTQVEIGELTIWYSYKTPIAFSEFTDRGWRKVVRENVWSKTTGSHMNEVAQEVAKKDRVSGGVFEQELSMAVERACRQSAASM